MKSPKSPLEPQLLLQVFFQHTGVSLLRRLTQHQNSSVKSLMKGSHQECFRFILAIVLAGERKYVTGLATVLLKNRIFNKSKLYKKILGMNLGKQYPSIEFLVSENHPARSCERTKEQFLEGRDFQWGISRKTRKSQ